MSDFELTMQEQPRRNERLTELDQLVGETILAAFDCTTDGEFVLVTENKNWIVLDAEESYSCEESATLIVKRERYGKPETLDEYVTPRDLLNAGVINPAVYQELQAKADAAAAAERERRAARLREELAKLEDGAAA